MEILTIKETAQRTGLTEYALRQGIKQGKYPYIKVGIGRGKILIDLDLLKEALKQEATDNCQKREELCKEYQDKHNTEVFRLGDISLGNILNNKHIS